MKRAAAIIVGMIALALPGQVLASVQGITLCAANPEWTATSNQQLMDAAMNLAPGGQYYAKDTWYDPSGDQISFYASKSIGGELACSFGDNADIMSEIEYDAVEAEYGVAPSYTGTDGGGSTIEADAQIANEGYISDVAAGDAAAAAEMGAAGTDAGIIGAGLTGLGAVATGVVAGAGAAQLGWNIGTQIDKWIGLPFMDEPWSGPSSSSGTGTGFPPVAIAEHPPDMAVAVEAGTCVGPGVQWIGATPVQGEGCDGGDIRSTGQAPVEVSPPYMTEAPAVDGAYNYWNITLPVTVLDVGYESSGHFTEEFGGLSCAQGSASNECPGQTTLPSESWASYNDDWAGSVYTGYANYGYYDGGGLPVDAGIEPVIGKASNTQPSGTTATATETPTEPSSPDPQKLFTDPNTQHVIGVIGSKVPGSTTSVPPNPPSLLTIPTPTPNEVYTDYSNQLTTDGFTNVAENVLSDAQADSSVGPNAVAGVSPSPGSQIAPDEQVHVDVNPSDAPSPGTSGGGFLPGPPTVTPTLPALPTPCGTIGGGNTLTGTNAAGAFNFPFGVPCWLVAVIGQFKTTPVAPHISWPVAPFGSLDVNLGTAFGGAIDSLMTYIRLFILFGAVVYIVRWFARVYGFGAVSGDSGGSDSDSDSDE